MTLQIRPHVCAVLLIVAACSRPDPVELERIVERDQLRREVAGLRGLTTLAPGALMDRSREVLVTVSDTLLRSLVQAAFPLDIAVRNHAVVRLDTAAVAFRANVARVELRGTVHRAAFPRIAGRVTLRGTLDRFIVDSTHALRARITLDDVALSAPSGAPAPLDPLVIAALQRIVERSLPELSAALPSVALPVRIDERMTLPGFGPDGFVSLEARTAGLTVEARRVIAFQNRIWISLGVTLGRFEPVAPLPAAAGKR